MRVAVVGSGVSGLGAAWALNEHSGHQVHLYEADSRHGGHANTVEFRRPDVENAISVDVDTGFIVFNPSTYPNFLRFLKLLQIPSLPTEMTFSVSRANGQFEWVFHVDNEHSACKSPSDLTIGSYLKREGYSNVFIDNYLIPMTASVWSTPPAICFEDFPALTLITFLNNHHLLQLIRKPSWFTIKGGSQVYVRRIVTRIPATQIHLSTSVASVSTIHHGGKLRVELVTSLGTKEIYDHVILACGSEDALKMLHKGGIMQSEDRILSKFTWNYNQVILHRDPTLMPKRRLAWSCWNYQAPLMAADSDAGEKFTLTYCMNQLQHIPERTYGPVLVTLNPFSPPSPEMIVGQYHYRHPIIDLKSVEAQKEMYEIQNVRGISFAGAYLGYGFHEDGFTRVAEAIGATIPFKIEYTSRDPGSLRLAIMFETIQNLIQTTRRTLNVFIKMCLISFYIISSSGW